MVSYLHRRQGLVLIVWTNTQRNSCSGDKCGKETIKTEYVAMHKRDTSNAQCKQAQDCSILLVHNRNVTQFQKQPKIIQCAALFCSFGSFFSPLFLFSFLSFSLFFWFFFSPDLSNKQRIWSCQSQMHLPKILTEQPIEHKDMLVSIGKFLRKGKIGLSMAHKGKTRFNSDWKKET